LFNTTQIMCINTLNVLICLLEFLIGIIFVFFSVKIFQHSTEIAMGTDYVPF
jgi:hypothetical protein